MSDAIDHLARAPGHCGHAPKCLRIGETDERDPLGCCNCGTRTTEQWRGLWVVVEGDLETRRIERVEAAEPSDMAEGALLLSVVLDDGRHGNIHVRRPRGGYVLTSVRP